MAAPRVAITGVGAYTCAGRSASELWASAREGRSGILGGVGRIDGTAPGEEKENTARSTFFAAHAAREAMATARWNRTKPDALVFATTTGRIPAWERPLVEHLRGNLAAEPFAEVFRSQPLSSALDGLKQELGFEGRTLLVSSACSAATQALALGAMWIRQGRAKRVLVVGAEVLCDLTLAGFGSLQLLAPEGARPFDRDRAGINLSEGAGAICLEAGDEGAAPLAMLSGYGLSTDGYHMTSPHPEGRGSYQAMRQALRTASLMPDAISWVHAHGTGSKHNDAAEGAALAYLFSEVPVAPYVSSTKRIHGHALGASGAIEAVLCVEAIRRATVLPTAGLVHPDPEIRVRHASGPIEQPVLHILKNTLGFGGTNASLVFSAPSAGGAA